MAVQSNVWPRPLGGRQWSDQARRQGVRHLVLSTNRAGRCIFLSIFNQWQPPKQTLEELGCAVLTWVKDLTPDCCGNVQPVGGTRPQVKFMLLCLPGQPLYLPGQGTHNGCFFWSVQIKTRCSLPSTNATIPPGAALWPIARNPPRHNSAQPVWNNGRKSQRNVIYLLLVETGWLPRLSWRHPPPPLLETVEGLLSRGRPVKQHFRRSKLTEEITTLQ